MDMNTLGVLYRLKSDCGVRIEVQKSVLCRRGEDGDVVRALT